MTIAISPDTGDSRITESLTQNRFDEFAMNLVYRNRCPAVMSRGHIPGGNIAQMGREGVPVLPEHSGEEFTLAWLFLMAEFSPKNAVC